MTLLNFGQPVEGVFQMAYTVRDIQASMKRWRDDLGVGPWFLLDHFTGDDPVYRGEPSKADVAIAMAFCGHMQIELIQPNDDHPSVYKESIDDRGHGFHHFGIGTLDFEADLRKYEARGFELAFRAGVPTGGDVGYMDTHGDLPGFVELIAVNEGMEAAFTNMYRASLGWDGSEPVRPFGSS